MSNDTNKDNQIEFSTEREESRTIEDLNEETTLPKKEVKKKEVPNKNNKNNKNKINLSDNKSKDKISKYNKTFYVDKEGNIKKKFFVAFSDFVKGTIEIIAILAILYFGIFLPYFKSEHKKQNIEVLNKEIDSIGDTFNKLVLGKEVVTDKEIILKKEKEINDNLKLLKNAQNTTNKKEKMINEMVNEMEKPNTEIVESMKNDSLNNEFKEIKKIEQLEPVKLMKIEKLNLPKPIEEDTININISSDLGIKKIEIPNNNLNQDTSTTTIPSTNTIKLPSNN